MNHNWVVMGFQLMGAKSHTIQLVFAHIRPSLGRCNVVLALIPFLHQLGPLSFSLSLFPSLQLYFNAGASCMVQF